MRIFDVLLSGAAVLILSPILLLVIVVLSFTGEREIFYQQERIGKHKKVFNLLKFATMLKNSPEIGTGTITIKDDPRVLPFGRFLRKTKINELPQLLNVLKGDMSLIGPRPLTKEVFMQYSENGQNVITKVLPGLSGLGSIYFRNEEHLLQQKNPSDVQEFYRSMIAPYKEELEIYFVNQCSLKLYFLLIFLTCWAVVMPSGLRIEKWIKDLPIAPF